MNCLNQILCGDCNELLNSLPNDSIDLVITSPPYFNQRDYGNGGIGNENTQNEYIENLLKVFEKCLEKVKDSGSIVFNLGDKYLEGSLELIPYKFAIAVLDRFKVKLVNNITWAKLNPTPRQDKRKLVQSTEPFFLFAKTSNYYFNQDAYLEHLDIIKQLSKKTNGNGNGIGKKYIDLIKTSSLTESEKSNALKDLEKVIQEVKAGELESFRMKIRDIHSQPFGGQEGGRKIQIEKNGYTIIRIFGKSLKKDIIESPVETIKGNIHPAVYPIFIIQQIIKLLTKETGIVLDPFAGSGTSCLAAKLINRKYIGIEINSDYVAYAEERIKETENSQMEMLFI